MTDYIVFPNIDPEHVFAPEIREAIAQMPEMKLAYAPRTGTYGYISQADVQALLASKMNSSEKGSPLGVAGLDANGFIQEGDIPQRLSAAGLVEAMVSKWKPRTFYPMGSGVLNPDGQVVTNKAAHTSDDEYNPSFWKLAPVDGGTP